MPAWSRNLSSGPEAVASYLTLRENLIPSNMLIGGGDQSNKSPKDQNPLTLSQCTQELQEHYGPLGFLVIETEPDGNCLFRAVADQMCGDAEVHLEYRTIATDFMEKHQNDFKDYVQNEDISLYIRRMQKPGTWGGFVEISALSLALKVEIKVTTQNKKDYLFSPPTNKNSKETKRLLLVYRADKEHYWSLRRNDKSSNDMTTLMEINPTSTSSLTSKVDMTLKSPISPNQVNNHVNSQLRGRSSSTIPHRNPPIKRKSSSLEQDNFKKIKVKAPCKESTNMDIRTLFAKHMKTKPESPPKLQVLRKENAGKNSKFSSPNINSIPEESLNCSLDFSQDQSKPSLPKMNSASKNSDKGPLYPQRGIQHLSSTLKKPPMIL